MKIWVDADACPGPIKDIIIKAATRLVVETIFVANKKLLIPTGPGVSQILVDSSSDAADRHIQEYAQSGDLVITQDIPLAHILVHSGIQVINPHGLELTPDNIGDRLAVRDLMYDLRSTGATTSGPKPFSDKEKRAFAATFDKVLMRLIRTKQT